MEGFQDQKGNHNDNHFSGPVESGTYKGGNVVLKSQVHFVTGLGQLFRTYNSLVNCVSELLGDI